VDFQEIVVPFCLVEESIKDAEMEFVLDSFEEGAKVLRGMMEEKDPDRKEIEKKMGMLLMHMAKMCDQLGTHLSEAARKNIIGVEDSSNG
jgi:hypothetical protein